MKDVVKGPINIYYISVVLGIVPHKENMQCINHCILYANHFIHKVRKKIVKPNITKFVRYYSRSIS